MSCECDDQVIPVKIGPGKHSNCKDYVLKICNKCRLYELDLDVENTNVQIVIDNYYKTYIGKIPWHPYDTIRSGIFMPEPDDSGTVFIWQCAVNSAKSTGKCGWISIQKIPNILYYSMDHQKNFDRVE